MNIKNRGYLIAVGVSALFSILAAKGAAFAASRRYNARAKFNNPKGNSGVMEMMSSISGSATHMVNASNAAIKRSPPEFKD